MFRAVGDKLQGQLLVLWEPPLSVRNCNTCTLTCKVFREEATLNRSQEEFLEDTKPPEYQKIFARLPTHSHKTE